MGAGPVPRAVVAATALVFRRSARSQAVGSPQSNCRRLEVKFFFGRTPAFAHQRGPWPPWDERASADVCQTVGCLRAVPCRLVKGCPHAGRLEPPAATAFCVVGERAQTGRWSPARVPVTSHCHGGRHRCHHSHCCWYCYCCPPRPRLGMWAFDLPPAPGPETGTRFSM